LDLVLVIRPGVFAFLFIKSSLSRVI